MAELDISGNFLITIGQGAGPETWLVVSVSDPEGRPVLLDFPQDPSDGTSPIHIFVALSAMFGAFQFDLRIAARELGNPGFYGLRLEAPPDLGVRLDQIRPSSLGIVVKTQRDAGQGLACDCGGAEVTSWFSDRIKERPDRQ